MKKRKVVNDPVYGFISIPNAFILSLVEHPYFQRLRRIAQLGLTYLVYPGANHTRFQHALGALHLMQQAIETLRQKDIEITEEEQNAVMAAILLHDIGHGPFSHALENSLVESVNHEQISILIMERLNEELGGKLSTCLAIFQNRYPKKFLHQLVSSQLDMDRLDYLKRDSFFSGVSEGVIGSGRIIKMLHVKEDRLVVESKGIYSIEKFLVARRLMYWQVYLHKTVLGAEFLLLRILQRAKFLANQGVKLSCTASLQLFLEEAPDFEAFTTDPKYLHAFSELDDTDVMSAIKTWQQANDFILSFLSKSLTKRKLFFNELHESQMLPSEKEALLNKISNTFSVSITDADWLIIDEQITNNAYSKDLDKINILYKTGEIKDIAEAADLLNISALSSPVNKNIRCFPRL